jgi:hypothetical protein
MGSLPVHGKNTYYERKRKKMRAMVITSIRAALPIIMNLEQVFFSLRRTKDQIYEMPKS